MASNSSGTATHDGATPITALDRDLISTHILTKFDGPTLASAACASTLMRNLCTEEKLWMEICNSTWTSIRDPRVRFIIPTFRAGYRSFFFDSYPALHHRCHPPPSQPHHHRRSLTTELISAVDIKYENVQLLSKVEITKTGTHSFLCSPFWIQVLHSKSPTPTPVKFTDEDDETFLFQLEHHTTLSWILIDPTRKRAANLSSGRPVLTTRDRVTGEVKLRYATVTGGGWTENVEWRIEVTCGVKRGGELIVKEVNMEVVEMDGRVLSGEESLVILEEAMEYGERKIGDEEGGGERYREFMEMGRENRENEEKINKFDFVELVSLLLISFLLLTIALINTEVS